MWYLALMNSSFIIHLDMSLTELIFWHIKHLATWLKRVNFRWKGRCFLMPKCSLWINRSNWLMRSVWPDSKTGMTEWYWVWNWSSSYLQVRIESGASDAYHPKAGPVRDWPKNRTLNGSDTEIIPSCVKYRLTCSMELAPSNPLNLVNSGSRYLGGSGIKS